MLLKIKISPAWVAGLLILQLFVGCTPETQQAGGWDRESETSGIRGRIINQDHPVDWAYGYAYPSEDTAFRRQFTAASDATGSDGTFTLYLKPGQYWVVARKRWNYAQIGPIRSGDYTYDYPDNPVTVTENQFLELGDLSLVEVRDNGMAPIPPGAGISGQVQNNDLAPGGSYAYIYFDSMTGLRGPSYHLSRPVEDDGSFQVDLRPGHYYLSIRARDSGSKIGPLKAIDLTYDHKGWVEVLASTYTDIGNLELKLVDPRKLSKINSGQLLERGHTGVTGVILDQAGQPVSGVYAFVYKDFQMVGKPLYRSRVTTADGRYELYLKDGGDYYIGARNTFGGPLEPGDIVGVYEGTPDHLVTVPAGQVLGKIDLAVKEFM